MADNVVMLELYNFLVPFFLKNVCYRLKIRALD